MVRYNVKKAAIDFKNSLNKSLELAKKEEVKPKTILVEVQIPEDYQDCHPEIIFDDFLENPKSFSVSLKEEK